MILTDEEMNELLNCDDPEKLELAQQALTRQAPEAAKLVDALVAFITDTEFGGE